MANKVIGDYTAAVSIDGSTHYLLIQPGGASTAYKKINRTVLLGITGDPVGTTDGQGLSNKVLDNTNVLTLKDNLLTLQDGGDITRQAQFQLSSITPGSTRIYTLPDATSTIANLTSTQTFTNKTLTSPVITGGTIDNSTITVDSIAGHTTPTSGTVYGLSVTTGTIAAAGIASNAVTTAKILDGAVTPAKLISGTGSTYVWASYTPTWTNLTVSSSTVTFRFIQIGKNVFFRGTVVLAGGNVPTGSVSFTLPVTAAAYAGVANTQPIANVSYNDSSTTVYVGYALYASTTTASLVAVPTNSTWASYSSTNATSPFTFGNGDEIFIQGMYEAA